VPETGYMAIGRCLSFQCEFHGQICDKRHVLSLFCENTSKSPGMPQDDFGKEFCLISRKGLRVQSRHGSGLVADSLARPQYQIITGQLI